MATAGTQLQDFRTEARALCMEKVARIITDAEMNRWCNKGIRNWSARVLWYERIIGLPAQANNPIIVLPGDFLKPLMIRYRDRGRLRDVDMTTHAERTFGGIGVGTPFRFTNTPKQKRLIMSPAPTVSSYTTTVTGEGGISPTATTIPVASTANFQLSGRILIDYGLGAAEQVEYYNTDALDFLICRRGDGDTTPASHLAGAVVTEAALVIYAKCLPADLSNDTDVTLMPEQYTQAIPFYMAAMAEWKRGDIKKAMALWEQYKEMRKDAEDESRDQDDMSEGVKDEEFGTGAFGDI
jgi:hypothetical protein